MGIYEVGFLLGRCHLQKRITLSDGSEAIPLGPTGFAGEIHDVRALLEKAGFKFTRIDLTNTLANFRDAGHVVLLKVPAIDAASFSSAIDLSNDRAVAAMGALAIVLCESGDRAVRVGKNGRGCWSQVLYSRRP